jgi:Tol biopolymer transport system component
MLRKHVVVLVAFLSLIAVGCRKRKSDDDQVKKALAFSVEKGGMSSLWYIAADKSSLTEVLSVDLGTHINNPTWSPDNRSIYFIRNSSDKGTNGVYRIKPNGNDLESIYIDNDTQSRRFYQLASSSDDEYVVFSLEIPRSNRKVIELYTMCPCGDRVRRLTSFEVLQQGQTISTEAYAGSFGPGDSVLYFSQADPNITTVKDIRIYAVNVNTKEPRLIKTLRGRDVAGATPNVSPDGSRLLLSLDGVIHVMNTDGENLRPVGTLKGFRPMWDKNGSDFYYSTFGIAGSQKGIYKSNIQLVSVEPIAADQSLGDFGGFAVNKGD